MKFLQLLKPISIWLFYAALIVVAALLLWPFPPQFGAWEYQDKIEHLAVFAALAMLGALAYENALNHVAIGLIAYGGIMEILQGALTSTRQASLADWLADSVGVALGLVIYRKLKKQNLA